MQAVDKMLVNLNQLLVFQEVVVVAALLANLQLVEVVEVVEVVVEVVARRWSGWPRLRSPRPG